MAAKKDFEGRFFDQLDDNFKRLEGQINDVSDELKVNTKTTQDGFKAVNDRLGPLEDEVFGKRKKTSIEGLPPVWRDPQILRLATIGAVILLILVGGKEALEVILP